jgi:hypothetical protein
MPRLAPSAESDGAAKPARVSSRGRITNAFLNDLADKWEQHGAEVLEELRRKSPEKFAQLAADLLPKEVQVQDANPFAAVQTTEEMRAIIVDLIIKEGWASDVVARMGGPIIEARAIENANQ